MISYFYGLIVGNGFDELIVGNGFDTSLIVCHLDAFLGFMFQELINVLDLVYNIDFKLFD
jgi:hypothetical protein